MCWRKSCEVVNELHIIDVTGAATLVIGGDSLLDFDDFMSYVDDDFSEMEQYLNGYESSTGEEEVGEECEESEKSEENEESDES
ncbi:hypothetical protein QE152_g40170 [Popillia japonica]|uniref:Uncharacterized protein n=1 Tax=Popillia japonica TaxID=7064 RepID=A0AAW1HS23_POPJA